MNATSDAMEKAGSGRKGMFLILGLLLSVGAMAGIFYYEGRMAGFDQERLGYTTQQQVLVHQMSATALRAAGGDSTAFDELTAYRDQFDQTLQKLRKGDKKSGLPASPESVSRELAVVESQWADYRARLDTVVDGKEVVSFISEAKQAIGQNMPTLMSYSEEVVNTMVATGASREQVRLAGRQLMLAQRIASNFDRVLAGEDAAAAIEQFAEDIEEFGYTLEGMVEGNDRTRQVENEEVQARLFDVAMLFKIVADYVEELLDNSEDFIEVEQAARELAGMGDQFSAAVSGLAAAYQKSAASRPVKAEHGVVAGVFALFFLVWLMITQVGEARRRSQVAEEANRRNQEAILRLLDEMGNLADGDLTRYATVTEDFTGAIADSINYTIDALRDMVSTINSTAEQMADSAERTRSTAVSLAQASEHQAHEITSASTAINEMAISIQEVAKNADESAAVARKSVDIASKGGAAVRRTIEGMDTIREQIQETSKRIKRLGESSQEIGDIVELINDIAEQTNILALNAAIQAAMAGEAGRGFAVVADEVQRLAERSSNATKQIEALVKTIQADTHEAVISMEQSTAGVVNGAQLSEAAGEALDEIETVSTELADLIENISASASQQSEAAAAISDTMNVIQEITTQTNAGTNDTAKSVGTLTELARELKRSVAGFKLPESA